MSSMELDMLSTQTSSPDGETHLNLAAFFVRKALQAEPLEPGVVEGLTGKSNESRKQKHRALHAHAWRRDLHLIRSISIWFLIALTFVETPRWCSSSSSDCQDENYYTYGWNLVTGKMTLPFEGLAVSFLLFDLYLWYNVLGRSSFLHWRWRVFNTALLVSMLLDVLVAAVQLPGYSWRLAPYCRALLLAAYDSTLQEQINSIVRSGSEFFKVLMLLSVYILVFSWLGAVMFTISGPEGEFFRDFYNSGWTLIVLLCTQNLPDVMMPGYTEHRYYSMFFVGFLTIGLFLFLPLLVAVVYSAYTRELAVTVKENTEVRQRVFSAAFDVLDVQKKGWLDTQQFFALLETLDEGGGFDLHDVERRTLVFAILDSHGTGRIDREEFGDLAKVLSLRFEKVRKPWLHRKAPRLWMSCKLHRVKEFIIHPHFEIGIDILLVISVIALVAETWPFLVGHEEERPNVFTWDEASDIGFTVLFAVEMLLKIFLIGWQQYWEKMHNRFDALATIGGLGAIIYVVWPNETHTYFLVKLAVLFRFFRLLRLLSDVPALQTIFASMRAILPGNRRVLPLIFCKLMWFTALGCDLFGGVITTDPKSEYSVKLKGTAFADSKYYPMNFNDAPSGLMTLFACLTMGCWDTYVNGFNAVCGGSAIIFFIIWWIVGVLLGLNLLTSVVVDAFVDLWVRQQEGQASATDAPGAAVIDANVVTGTPTNLKGQWTVTDSTGSQSLAAMLAAREGSELASSS